MASEEQRKKVFWEHPDAEFLDASAAEPDILDNALMAINFLLYNMSGAELPHRRKQVPASGPAVGELSNDESDETP